MQRIAALMLLLSVLSAPARADETLNANPGPSNNMGLTGWAMFQNVSAVNDLAITGLTTGSTAAASAPYQIRVHAREGSALGGPVGTGVGSSTTGWTLHATIDLTQGATANGVSLPATMPDLPVAAGSTVGIALEFVGAGPRYFGTAAAPLETYSDANLSLVTGDARSTPFTVIGNFFSSRALVGSLTYRLTTVAGIFADGFE